MACFSLIMGGLPAPCGTFASISRSSKCSKTSNCSGPPAHDACGTGFIARLGGAPSYDIIQFALTALERLTHRGGVDADGASGDGAGLLTSLPHAFFRACAQEQGIELPEMFAVGFAFLPASVVEDAPAPV